MTTRRALIVSIAVGCVAAGTVGRASASEGYKTPARLEQLARLDAQVRFVRRRQRGKRVFVVRWRGNPWIIVGRDATLADARRAAHALVLRGPHGVWALRAPLFVANGATLTIAAPAVRELRLLSRARSYATIVAQNANVRFVGSARRRLLVRSWNRARSRPDLNLDNGRGSVSVRGNGRLSASYAVFSYLGFTFGRVSGVAVNGTGPQLKGSGRVDHSIFSHNVFGAYTWQAIDMHWTSNRFVHNMVYGFDPHDGSNWFVVEHNYAAANGRHGIIFSRLCKHDVIADNVSARNGWHGIVIDAGRAGRVAPSRDIHVYRNVVRNNGKVGISIDGSNDNVVRDNRVSGGLIGIRVFGRPHGQATGNVITGNRIIGAREIGVLVAKPASDTRLAGDTINGSVDGIAVRGARSTFVAYSKVAAARLHAVSITDASATRISGNRFSGAGPSPIKTLRDTRSVERANLVHWDYPLLHDAARLMSWFIGPGVWALLFFVVLTSGVVARGVETATKRRARHSPAAAPPPTASRPAA